MKNSLKTRGFIAGIALLVAALAVFFSVESINKANTNAKDVAATKNLVETVQKNTVDGLQVIGKKVGSVVPATPSVFETSLAASISTADTSLSLSSGTLRDGTSLSGYYCFTIDESTPTLEYVCGTASGTTVTSVQRGIDPVSGTTTVSSLTYAHRRGADVKVSDYPVLGILSRIAAGIDTFAQPVRYDSSIATTTIAADRSNLASAGLVADTAFNGAGVINATTAARGIVQIATGAQLAAGVTVGSSGANLAAPASAATSTFVSGASNKLVVTDSNNKIDLNFIATSTGFFKNPNFSGTTTISSAIPFVASSTVTTTDGTVFTLSNIQSTGDYLRVIIFASSTNASNISGNRITFNNDTGGNYINQSNPNQLGVSIDGWIQGSVKGQVYEILDIYNPNGAPKMIHIVSDQWNGSTGLLYSTSTTALWRNNAQINRIDVTNPTGAGYANGFIKVYQNSN